MTLNQLEINPKMLNHSAVVFAEVCLHGLESATENLADSFCGTVAHVRIE
jgi:hypothetical protein